MLTALHFLQETDGSVAPGLTGNDKVRKRIKAAIHVLDMDDYAVDPAERDRLAREASSCKLGQQIPKRSITKSITRDVVAPDR